MSDLPAARRLGANIVASEFQHLRPEHKAVLARAFPDLHAALAEFTGRFYVAKGGEPVITTTDAAVILGISPRAVRLAVERGRLTAFGDERDGYLFDRGHLDAYAATRRRSPIA